MRKPEVMVAKGGGGGSSSSNSWGSGLCAKSCRLLQKWTNSTTSTTKKKKSSHVKGGNVHSSTKFKFGEDEDDLIIKLHALLGNRWSLIAGRLPGRTDNEVKNYWNSHLRKKLQNKGIESASRRSVSHQTVVPTNFMTSVKAARTSYNNQVVSDAVSSFSADYGTTTSPMAMPTDLNLELTLTINPSPSSLISSCRFTETDQQHVDQFKLGINMDHHDQFMKNETLLLFQ